MLGIGVFFICFFPVVLGFGWRGMKTPGGMCQARHAAALTTTLGMVADQVGVEVLLHGRDTLVETLATHGAEVLVDEDAAKTLNKALGLESSDFFGAVLNGLELGEQFVGASA